MNVMLDLETMGRSPDGAIASIGAIRFDPDGEELKDPFHCIVRLEGQDHIGMTFDPETIVWWLQQSKEAQESITRGDRVDLRSALSQFKDWYKGEPCWAYGSTFDHVILNTAFTKTGIENPITYRNQMCMRGIARFSKVERPQYGTQHNAVEDATAQAMWMQLISGGRKPLTI